ncbi:MAG TPA: type VII secretion-associated serine protease mycosin [Pseudonocardiaceae bacterium]|nr:type VII secretion-associated serine protease mycosin [Pseudonocardiaceae bacterium]
MTRYGGGARLGAVAIAVLCLAAEPIGWSAAAPPSAQPDASSWMPPPVNPAALPVDTPPGPPAGVTYTQKFGCVSSVDDNAPLPDEPAAQQMLDIRTAQQFSTGAGVKVAVIDTGVNPNRLLTDNNRLKGGGDYITPGQADGTLDCDGHGTLTAGIVAANTSHTDFGFTGVAPAATIYSIRQTSKVYDEQFHGQDTGLTAGTPSTLASAIVHAVNLGVNVITTSVDVCQPTATAVAEMRQFGSPVQELQAAIAYAVEHDVVVVNSAGNVVSQPEGGQQASNNPCANIPQNDNPNPNDVREIEIPAVFSNDLLSVASVSPITGSVSMFSVWGPWVNIAAPGEGIVSVNPARGGQGLARLFAEPDSNTRAPGPIQGTSFAAPYVAGVVALVRAKYPKLTARQVITRIEATAQHPSGPGGRNNQIGYGVINPVAALTAAIPGQNGVPAVGDNQVPVVLPGGPVQDWAPVRVALIGTAVAMALLFGTVFVVRTVRRRRT